MYDIIGDIHGHADALEQLLQKLGYAVTNGYYKHPERKVIFVGDYIDRGPKIRETLQIVRSMSDNQAAIALMGNHEFNAILYNTKGKDGRYLRERTEKNNDQHKETLEQFSGADSEYNDYINWFMTLPLYYEEEALRVVHACWDEGHIQYLRSVLHDDTLTHDLILQDYEEGTDLYEAIEVTLKGKEIQMPDGLYFIDKGNHKRNALRIKWWLRPELLTYKEYSVEHYDSLTNDPIPENLLLNSRPYAATEKPVFFGHYWLKGAAPASVYASNVCCVDYSVANAGKLVAYRWNGENSLHHSNMHHVSPKLAKQ